MMFILHTQHLCTFHTISLNIGTGEVSVNKWVNKVILLMILKK